MKKLFFVLLLCCQCFCETSEEIDDSEDPKSYRIPTETEIKTYKNTKWSRAALEAAAWGFTLWGVYDGVQRYQLAQSFDKADIDPGLTFKVGFAVDALLIVTGVVSMFSLMD